MLDFCLCCPETLQDYQVTGWESLELQKGVGGETRDEQVALLVFPLVTSMPPTSSWHYSTRVPNVAMQKTPHSQKCREIKDTIEIKKKKNNSLKSRKIWKSKCRTLQINLAQPQDAISQGSQTRGPRAACGSPGVCLRPAQPGISEEKNILFLFFLMMFSLSLTPSV